MKKIFLTLIFTLFFVTPLVNAETTGSCGENAYWSLSDTGVLTISGSGAIYDYGMFDYKPWEFDDILVTKLIVEDGITHIGASLFRFNDYLREASIGNDVKTIGEYAFDSCRNLNSVKMGNKIETIGESAFGCCTSLKELKLPNSVTTIKRLAFNGCEELKELLLPESITIIEDGAFFYCASLVNIVLPTNLTTINNELFRACYSLEKIIIHNNIKYIGDWAFSDCDALTNIIIPDSVTQLGYGSFMLCDNLTTVMLPDNINSIPEGTFAECINLKTIGITNSIKNIENCSFGACSSLKTIYYAGTAEEFNSIKIGTENIYFSIADLILTDRITITYNSENSTNLPSAIHIFPKVSTTLSTIIPIRKGHTFLGWTTDYLSDKVEYLPGSTISFESDTNLYAIWQENICTITEKSGDSFSVTPYGLSENDIILFVCYNSGIMTYFDKYKYDGSQTIPFYTNVEYDKINIFVWNSLEKISPITHPETFLAK